MQRVKICGITNLEDALNAIENGADALGFVFYKPSPRYICPQDAKEIVKSLPPFVERVGLFVNEEAQAIDKICKETNMSLAQIHFEVDEVFLDSLEIKAIPVIRAKEAKDIEQFGDRYRLVDAYCEAYGGSGKRINLEWFDGIDCSKIILAGGLDPSNVASTIRYNFYGVDVSSGTERAKGKKDHEKVKDFINNAKTI
ncbi:MAG: phosphoribosylanthranilate isomerase [Campylobacterales bacterium]|nr:phosphoribosylanthranilate isomerase [Campylobacterales bacterium]